MGVADTLEPCLLSILKNQSKIVYGQFGQSNMHITFDFLPQTSKEGNECTTNKEKLRAYYPDIEGVSKRSRLG